MNWITDKIAIGMWDEQTPDNAVRLDLRHIPDHCAIPHRYFTESIQFIDDAITAGHRVFVHCIGGVSRSPAIVAAYLGVKLNLSARAAFEMVRVAMPIIEPHQSQRRSVEAFLARQEQ